MKVFANGYGLVDFRILERETNEGIKQVKGDILVPENAISAEAGTWISWNYWFALSEVFLSMEEIYAVADDYRQNFDKEIKGRGSIKV